MMPSRTHPPTAPAREEFTTVYAKWRGRLPVGRPNETPATFIDRYHIVVTPSSPLSVGKKIKIHALSPVAYRIPENTTPQHGVYDTYDPQVCGRLVRIRAMNIDTVEFVLDNEAPNEKVVLAYVAVQNIPNCTTKLAETENVCVWSAENQLPVIFMPLENATIVQNAATIGHRGGESYVKSGAMTTFGCMRRASGMAREGTRDATDRALELVRTHSQVTSGN